MSIAPIEALRALHDELWDPDRGLERYAPGAAPDADLSARDLHAVRETANAAFLDLSDGNVGRATTALRGVLALQYPASDRPWSGTFPTSAEQRRPPDHGAVEWVHYDPNWRQFIGCALALCSIEFGDVLPGDVVAGITAALRGCVAGEPGDRIPRWYTNPNLMHAWLQGHVAMTTGDDALRASAHARLSTQVERLLRYGDVDEYNSPTYDGIDLFAIGLWAMHPPTGAFADGAATMLPRIGERISELYHPRFGTSCGPYIRAYGLDPHGYLSLTGLLYSVLGEPAERVLPSPIVADTAHVHDLWFLPLLQHVAPVLAPHVELSPVTQERHRVQRFRLAHAESLLRPDLAVGWERGRRHEASLDQYVPFTSHVAELDGTPTAFGIMVPPETAWIDVERVGDLRFVARAEGRGDTVGVRVIGRADLDDETGRVRMQFETPPTTVVAARSHGRDELHLEWASNETIVEITIAG